MLHARYPHSFNHAVLAAQRGAAIAKGIVGVAILGGVLAMVALAARDVQHSPSLQARSGASAPSAADPQEVGDDRSNVYGVSAMREPVKAPILIDPETPRFERSNEPAIEVDLANAHGG